MKLSIYKKSFVFLYIILTGFIAGCTTLLITSNQKINSDISFIGESALSVYANENKAFSQLMFIQTAAHFSLQKALGDLPATLTSCSKYGTYQVWQASAELCFPSKAKIDTNLKQQFFASFKQKLDANKDLSITGENYEYSVINNDHLKFLGIATSGISYDVAYDAPLTPQIPAGSYGEFVPFRCASRIAKNVCLLKPKAYNQLLAAAKLAEKQNEEIIITSAYRSKDDQEQLCGGLVNGKCKNRNAAVPGESSHQSGGAVDVILVMNGNRGACGKLDIKEKAKLDDYATAPDKLGKYINTCRQTLKNIMIHAGFINLPSEWWHWEYGTRMWADIKSKEAQAKVEPLYQIT